MDKFSIQSLSRDLQSVKLHHSHSQAAFLAPRLLTKSLPCGIMHSALINTTMLSDQVKPTKSSTPRPPFHSSSLKFYWCKCTKSQACAQAAGAIWICWNHLAMHISTCMETTFSERDSDREENGQMIQTITSLSLHAAVSLAAADSFYTASMWKALI